MRIAGPLVEAAFVERPNRFVVVAEPTEGSEGKVRAHLPNPGRLTEFLDPGTAFLLRRVDPGAVRAGGRSTTHDVVAARHRGTWVVLDTRLANDVLAEALDAGRLDEAFPGLDGPGDVEREPGHGDGRLDFRLETADGPVLVEAKAVTLLDEADGETGLFPDAPTERGTRHLEDLAAIARGGDVEAAVVFVAMRSDVVRVRPHRARDPAFADALQAAADAGVRGLAYGTRFEVADDEGAGDGSGEAPGARFELADPLPVDLEA